ncbi:MAG: MogA/MoaB family molybdenum cofactor biosynthesis protein [Nitrospinae bacterium]|nr:MogA/MoaB family molybdenum cofactor biosynthesis protein [Nitrospinota bacterium]
MFTVVVLTLSDKGARGERVDESGKIVADMLQGISGRVEKYEVIPDDQALIQEKLVFYADQLGVDVIATTGGTGVGPRDVTPDATRVVIDKEIPGMAEAMRLAGLKKTPLAMISRAIVGCRGKTLIVNLPGSPKGVRENLEAILAAIPHAVEKLKGDPTECAVPGT